MASTSSAGCEQDLLRNQARQLNLLLSRMLSAVARLGGPADQVSNARPNNVFCIDGGRGAGKTYCLLTLDKLLRSVFPDELKGMKSKGWDAMILPHETQLRAIRSRTKHGTLLQPLRVIFPGDMERQELLLEAIFAGIRSDIETQLREEHDPQYRRTGEALRASLIDEVSRAWSFARRLGVDAVVRNSLDYNDLVHRYDDLNKLAAERLSKWHEFIERYLTWRGTECLAILLDDSDVRPELTYDILHCARTALNHPRIVTVIAGNSSSMRRSLLLLAMRELSPSIPALNQEGHRTAENWRRQARIEVEQLLEKVLPASRRFYINRPETRSDFRRITKPLTADGSGLTLIEVCESALAQRRAEFIRVKILRAVNYEIDFNDAPDERQAARLQDYLAWWVFRTKYANLIGPNNPRQIEGFAEYYLNDSPSPAVQVAPRWTAQKRLPVMLFANPLNYALIQRLGDDDPNVIGWLMRQSLKSSWLGTRSFSINDREVSEGTYSYDFLRFRLDVGLSQPLRKNSEALVPEGLLPWIRGRLRMRPFFLPRQMPRRMRRLGVARWLSHAAVPANCIYFHDLSAIPDVFFTRRLKHPKGSEGASWEASLWGRWPALLDVGRNDMIQRYITEIVFQRLRYTANVRTTALIEALEPPEHTKVNIPYRSFIDFEISTLNLVQYENHRFKAVSEIMEKELPPLLNEAGYNRAADLSSREDLEAHFENPLTTQHMIRVIARYSAITTDLRRGWAAIRIYENALRSVPEDTDSDRRGPESTSMQHLIENADKMRLYTVDDFEGVLKQDPWVWAMLAKFKATNITKLLDACEGASRREAQKKVQLDALKADWEDKIPNLKEAIEQLVAQTLAGANGDGKPRLLVQARDLLALISNRPEPEQQAHSSKVWVAGWRQIGRLICDGWFLEADAEDVLFDGDAKELRLDIFDGSAATKSKWKSARTFTWFLYGIASSLPAMVHADLLSHAYRIRQLGHFETPRPSDNDARIAQTFANLRTAIARWDSLVVQITGLVRYIKMKNLHLYCSLTAERIVGRRRGELNCEEERSAVLDDDLKLDRLEALQSRILDAVRRIGGPTEQEQQKVHASGKINILRDALNGGDLWNGLSAVLTDGKSLETSTHMMPDASPSTLFGDQWLEDVVVRLLGCEQTETAEGVSYSGIFGETERWLWASHYMIGIAERVLSERVLKHAPAAGVSAVAGGS